MQAAHVAQHEEGCSAYELSVNTDDPDSFVIYERWVHLGLSKCILQQGHTGQRRRRLLANAQPRLLHALALDS
jgi:quinol monooxygenase YgiN